MVIQAANRLFEANGFNATGIDQIAAESHVTKRTIYKHFGSKEGLIEVVLIQHQAEMMEYIRSELDRLPEEGEERLLRCFELYREWFAKPNFSGCIFLKTFNEFGHCSTKLAQLARKSKKLMRDLLVGLAEKVGAKDSELLANQLHLLLEGSIVVAQSGVGSQIVDLSQAMAVELIKKSK